MFLAPFKSLILEWSDFSSRHFFDTFSKDSILLLDISGLEVVALAWFQNWTLFLLNIFEDWNKILLIADFSLIFSLES